MFSGFSQQRGMILIFEHSIFFGHKLFIVAGKRVGVVGCENCVFRMHSLRTNDDGNRATKGRGATLTGFSNHFNDVLKSVRVFTRIDLYWRNATLNEMLHKFITWRDFKSAALLLKIWKIDFYWHFLHQNCRLNIFLRLVNIPLRFTSLHLWFVPESCAASVFKSHKNSTM